MLRNFNMVNRRPLRPTRAWWKSTGPGENILISAAMSRSRGDRSIDPASASRKSKARLNKRMLLAQVGVGDGKQRRMGELGDAEMSAQLFEGMQIDECLYAEAAATFERLAQPGGRQRGGNQKDAIDHLRLENFFELFESAQVREPYDPVFRTAGPSRYPMTRIPHAAWAVTSCAISSARVPPPATR